MLRHLRREKDGFCHRGTRRPGVLGPGKLAAAVLAIALVSTLEAQGNQALRAIEKLEGCSDRERKQGCVKILKKKRTGDGRQSIKAQVRGERIIWYEYDSDSGEVRRTN